MRFFLKFTGRRLLAFTLVSVGLGNVLASAQDFPLLLTSENQTPPAASDASASPVSTESPTVAPLPPEGETRHVNVRRDPTGEIHITLSLTNRGGTSVKAWRATSLPDLKANQPEGYEVFVEFLKGEVAARARQRALMRALREKANGQDSQTNGDDELTEEEDVKEGPELPAKPPALAEKADGLPRLIVLPQTSAAWPSQEEQPRQIIADIGGGRIAIRDTVDGMISITWRPLSESKGKERTWMGNSIDRLQNSDPQLAEWYKKLTGGAMTARDLAKAPLGDSGMSAIGWLPPPPPPPLPGADFAPVPITEVGGLLPLAPIPVAPVPQPE